VKSDIPIDRFFKSYDGKDLSLACWLRESIRYLYENPPAGEHLADSFVELWLSNLVEIYDWPSVKVVCYALIASRHDGYKDSVNKILAEMSSIMINTDGRYPTAPSELDYHFIKSFVVGSNAEAIYHLKEAREIADENSIKIFGMAPTCAEIDRLLAHQFYNQKMTKLDLHRDDLSWFQRELFRGVDFASPEACLADIPSDLCSILIDATAQMLLHKQMYDVALYWIDHGLRLAMDSHDQTNLGALSFLYYELIRKKPLTPFSAAALEALLTTNLHLQSNMQNSENMLSSVFYLWLSHVAASGDEKEAVAEYAWKYLAISGVLEGFNGKFLRPLCEILHHDVCSLVLFNALRAVNGLEQMFELTDELSLAEPFGSFESKKNKRTESERIYMPALLLESLVLISKRRDVGLKDPLKFCEVVEYLVKSLEAGQSHVVRTNEGILGRYLDSDFLSCWNDTAVHLFECSALDRLLGLAIYRRYKVLESFTSNKKRTAHQVRGWRDDLLRALPGCMTRRVWTALAESSMELIHLELAEDYEYIMGIREDLQKDVRIALCAVVQSSLDEGEKIVLMAEVYMLIADGPLGFIAADISPKDLNKALIAFVQCRRSDDLTVLQALAQASRGNPHVQMKILKLILSKTSPNAGFEEKYDAVMGVFEAWERDRGSVDVEWIHGQLVGLGLIRDIGVDESVTSSSPTEMVHGWLQDLGSLDNKKTQHRHIFLACQLYPSIASWSRLFPFLSKSKNAPFIAVWQCDQDRAGMHMLYKGRYSSALLKWIAEDAADNEESAMVYLMACKKICANLYDMVEGQEVVGAALNGLVRLKQGGSASAVDLESIYAVLKKHCTDETKLKSVEEAPSSIA